MDLHMEDALLTGLVVCGNCGRRLKTDHPAHGKSYYRRARHLYEATEQACFGLKATVVDDLVRDQVLHALEPAALELSCRALEDVQRDRARLDKHWKQRLERARYEADDAERGYRAVDPENQLVARSLEKRWEETLRAERQVRDDYDRFLREQPPQLSSEERARIAALSLPPSPHCGTSPGRPTRIARSSSGTSWIKSSFMWSTIVNI